MLSPMTAVPRQSSRAGVGIVACGCPIHGG
jgi:hypothetical protein